MRGRDHCRKIDVQAACFAGLKLAEVRLLSRELLDRAVRGRKVEGLPGLGQHRREVQAAGALGGLHLSFLDQGVNPALAGLHLDAFPVRREVAGQPRDLGLGVGEFLLQALPLDFERGHFGLQFLNSGHFAVSLCKIDGDRVAAPGQRDRAQPVDSWHGGP